MNMYEFFETLLNRRWLNMLLQYQRLPHATAPRWKRLLCLEGHLRKSSEGRYKIQDYLEWIEMDGLVTPGRQALHDDFAYYSALCDDVEYGSGSHWLVINSSVADDALTWFLGAGWITAAIRPRLSSSICRCLLLAKEERQEVRFTYAKLNQLGRGVAEAETWRVIPVSVLPGLDSAYMGMWLHSGKVAHFNLARVLGQVSRTTRDSSSYLPIERPIEEHYVVDHDDRDILNKIRTQFAGLHDDPQRAGLGITLLGDQTFFVKEMLNSWCQRIQQRALIEKPHGLRWEQTAPSNTKMEEQQ